MVDITIFMMTRKNYLVGSHKVFKISDSVKIRVENVSIAKAEIDFAFI